MRGEGDAVGIIDRADLSVTMSQWSSGHRAFTVETFLKSNDSYVIVRRQFFSKFGIRRIRDGPSVNLIRSWVQRFYATASSMNVPRPGPSRSSRTPENIELVESSLRENPRLSSKTIKHRKYQKPLHFPKVTVWCASSTHEIIRPFFF